MKTISVPSLNIARAALVTLVAGLASSSPLWAEDSVAAATATEAPQMSVQDAAPPQLSYGVAQIAQLSQAKVDDATIISYIKNSGNSYRLNADQIIYLRQQGVSSEVINTMLNQPRPGGMAYNNNSYSAPSAPAPAVVAAPSYPAPAVYAEQPAAPTVVVGPAVTAIDPTAAAYYSYSYYPAYASYAYPYYYSSYCYPRYGYPRYYPSCGYYGCAPGVAVSFGFGHGFHGGFHEGFRGGFGGGFHGGFSGGFHSGFHR